MSSNESHDVNKSEKLFSSLCKLVYLAGFPNFWIKELDYSEKFLKFYDIFVNFINTSIYVFIASEWAASFTQLNMTERQTFDSMLFNYSHPILTSYRFIMTHHKDKIKELIFYLSVNLKEAYNDETVEQEMIRKSKKCIAAFLSMCSLSLIFYGVDGVFMTLTETDATFTTVITFWPDVEDKSAAAKVARVGLYIMWWVFLTRVFAAYSLVFALMVALEHQYKTLRSYFKGLNKIFKEDLSQEEKEKKYEDGVKVGIKLHSDTIKCAQLAQETCSTIYCLQILLNISVIVLLMTQMAKTERTPGKIITTATTGGATLISTGFFMWTAGDVTIEASYLSTDMYWSGWHRCCERSVSVRRLLAVAMAQAQKPVVIKGLGVIKISYRAYLSIVRSSYSIFTVLY